MKTKLTFNGLSAKLADNYATCGYFVYSDELLKSLI